MPKSHFHLESALSDEIKSIASTLPNHLVIYAGSPSPTPMVRRQSLSPFAPSPTGGILHRYQLLTPALIIILLITFFLLVPILFFGVSALASIQSPLKVEAPKGYNAQERKNR